LDTNVSEAVPPPSSGWKCVVKDVSSPLLAPEKWVPDVFLNMHFKTENGGSMSS